MEIKRYSIHWNQQEEIEDPEGEFIRYEDHKAKCDELGTTATSASDELFKLIESMKPRPIETAPKDGTYILVWDTYANCWFIAKWALHKQFSGHGEKDFAWCIGCTRTDRGFNTAGFPKFWLPLPPEVK